MKYIIHILIAMLFLPACAEKIVYGTSERVLSEEFTSIEYMTATGIGKTESEARRQAKAEMSNIFESKVFSSTINRVTSIVDEAGNELINRDAEQKIKVISSVDIKGLEIGKTWQDDKDGLYFALAILDRKKTGEQWRHEIDSIDSQIESDLESLSSMESDFTRFQSLKKMRSLWLNREVTLSRLQVLGFPMPDSINYGIKTIVKNINQIKSSMIIFIDAEDNEHSKELSAMVSESLTKAGYVIGKAPDYADIVIKLSLKIEQVDLDNPSWEFARATASVVIVDSRAELKVGEITENKRASHLTLEEASHKASRKVFKLVTEKLTDYFGDGR